MSCRGISTIGRAGVAALVALAFALLALPAAASAADGGISGRVTQDAGRVPLPGAAVCAEQLGGAFEFACATAGAAGNYLIPDLPPGQYVVSAYAGDSGLNLAPRYYPGVDVWGEASEITVASSTVPEIDISLLAGATLSGTVTELATGAPIESVEVCTYLLQENEFEGCEDTAADGSYEIEQLRGGVHFVHFRAVDVGYENRLLEQVVIFDGSTLNMDAALVRAEASISGRVRLVGTLQPVSDVVVCAIEELEELCRCSRTDDSGTYLIALLPAGRWKVVFSPDPSEFPPLELGEIESDAWPTQFWGGWTIGSAIPISVAHNDAVLGKDALVGSGPDLPIPTMPSPGKSPEHDASEPPPEPALTEVPLSPQIEAVHCGKGKVKKRVKGKLRCVKRHKARHGQKRHHASR